MRHILPQYKGYSGSVEFDFESGILHGEVIGIRDVITFQGKTVDELNVAFQDSIDDYLTWCDERSEEPERPYSGKFNLRIGPELHQRIALEAATREQSMNSLIENILLSYIHQLDKSSENGPNEAVM